MSRKEERMVFGVTPPPMNFDEEALRKLPAGLQLYQVEVIATTQMVVLATSRQEAESLAETHHSEEDDEPSYEFFGQTPPLVAVNHFPNYVPWGEVPAGFEDLGLKDWSEILAMRADLPEKEDHALSSESTDTNTMDLFGGGL